MVHTVANPFACEANASTYHAYRPQYHHIPFGHLKKILGEVDTALDVACGTGHSTAALSRICRSVRGCDASPTMLAEAKKNYSIATFHLAAAEDLPFVSHGFSLVNISMGIHWVDQERFLHAAGRVLQPSGHLSIDNYGFDGRIVAHESFEAFYKDFYSCHFPPPLRGPNYPEEEKMRAANFIPIEDFSYTHVVAMSLEEFIGFNLSQSNVIVSGLRDAQTVFERAYFPYFGAERRNLVFSGRLKLYQRAVKI